MTKIIPPNAATYAQLHSIEPLGRKSNSNSIGYQLVALLVVALVVGWR